MLLFRVMLKLKVYMLSFLLIWMHRTIDQNANLIKCLILEVCIVYIYIQMMMKWWSTYAIPLGFLYNVDIKCHWYVFMHISKCCSTAREKLYYLEMPLENATRPAEHWISLPTFLSILLIGYTAYCFANNCREL